MSVATNVHFSDRYRARHVIDETILDQLRSEGYRFTPQRLTILRILQEADGHLSPTQVYQRARDELPGLTDATVYRTLDFLKEQGLLWVGQTGGGNLVYEIAEQAHHHLICRKCGEMVAVKHDVIEALYERLQAMTDYSLDSRHLTFFGLCSDCQPRDE